MPNCGGSFLQQEFLGLKFTFTNQGLRQDWEIILRCRDLKNQGGSNNANILKKIVRGKFLSFLSNFKNAYFCY